MWTPVDARPRLESSGHVRLLVLPCVRERAPVLGQMAEMDIL